MKAKYLMKTCHLNQLVTKPTHIMSIIDLCYTNMKDFYLPPHHEPGIGISKHQVVICSPCSTGFKPPQQTYITKRSQRPRASAAMSGVIQSLVWTPLFTLPTCEEQFQMFTDVLSSLINDLLPIKTVKRNENDMPWVTDNFHQLIGLWQYHFHSGNTMMFNYYRNKVNRNRKQLMSKFYSSKMDNLNPHNWWKEINLITGMKNKKSSLQGMANSLYDGDIQLLAEKISAALQAVIDDIKPLSPDDCFTTGVDTQDHLADCYSISVSQVEHSLKKINVKKSVGPDNIPNWILHELAPWMAQTHMCHLELKLQGIICSKVMEICRYLRLTKSAAPDEG